MATKRTYEVGLVLRARGSAKGALDSASKSASTLADKLMSAQAATEGWGRSMVASSLGAARAYAGIAAKIGGAGVAGAAALMAAKGWEMQTSTESAKNAIAGTLQLFNHSAGAADQLGRNVQIAEIALGRLNDIANKSPGELKDVQNLFQSMLPGARSITADMERILDLTQKAAMLTPVFGGDFALTGNQLSRMMTGGAGAEMETWRTIQKVVLDVGQEMTKTGSKTEKIFGEGQQMGEQLTMAFNKLAPEDRLRVLEASFARSGSDMADMFANSWEGASSTFKSGWRQIAGAMARPLFESTKKALIKATADGGVFSSDTVKRMQNAAESVGMHFARMAEGAFTRIAAGIAYLETNWKRVANTVYHAFQIGSGMVKAAFMFGFTKMVAGAAIMAASMAGRAVGAAGRGVAGAGRAGMAIGRGAKSVVGFGRMVADFGSFATLGKTLASAASSALMLGMAMAPLVLVAGAAALAVGGLVVIVAGVAAYIASEWDSLMKSVRDGFASGELTLRPLVVAAMVLWERFKEVGRAMLGGVTGATMMQGAIDMAVGAIDMLTSGVSGLIEIAADFMDFVAEMKSMFGSEGGTSHRYDRAELERREKMGIHLDSAQRQALASYRAQESHAKMLESAGFGGIARGFQAGLGAVQGSGAQRWKDRATSLREAAGAWRKAGLKDLDFEEVNRYIKQLEDKLLGATEEGKPPKKPKGPNVNIGTLNINQDLRGMDPDRVMMQLVTPLQKVAAMPQGATLGPGGF